MGYDIEKEKREAIEAGRRALNSLSAAKENLNSAKNWGLVDMFGGGFFSTMLKHSKMDHAKQNMDQAKYDLRNFSRELNDVNMACDLHIDTGDFLLLSEDCSKLYAQLQLLLFFLFQYHILFVFFLLIHYECDVTNAIMPPTINNGKAMYISPPTTIPINITGKKITVQSSFIIPQDALNPKTKNFPTNQIIQIVNNNDNIFFSF